MDLWVEAKMTPTSLTTECLERELTDQVITLIQDAPDDRTTPQGIATIAPLFAKIALSRLNHAYYHVIQDEAGALLRIISTHSKHSSGEKTMVFAFSTEEEASLERDNLDEPNALIIKVAVLELLFRFWALNWCDALIFFDRPGDRTQGHAITHAELTNLLQQELAPPKKRSGGQGFGTLC
jgi:hypothetical protein